jgi:hypothetical protein
MDSKSREARTGSAVGKSEPVAFLLISHHTEKKEEQRWTFGL